MMYFRSFEHVDNKAEFLLLLLLLSLQQNTMYHILFENVSFHACFCKILQIN